MFVELVPELSGVMLPLKFVEGERRADAAVGLGFFLFSFFFLDAHRLFYSIDKE